ncbi:hypothetical protein EH30_09215 [Erythrobacter sp. JL475]|nr:hypothetical protein EH30_09215 [Erythrobacter sp. JL475]
MSAPSARQGLLGDLTSCFAPFTNAFTFHVCDLGKDGNNQLAHTSTDCSETLHFEFDPKIKQMADGYLNI